MDRYLFCAETERGLYHGSVRAESEAQARRLVAKYFEYGEYGRVEQLDLHRIQQREEVQIHLFNGYEID